MAHSMDTSNVTMIDVATYRVLEKDREKFFGGLSRSESLVIWKDGLKLPVELLKGIALNQMLNRPLW